MTDVEAAAAKANKTNSHIMCGCPGSEKGKIKISISSHMPGCWVRKKLLAEGFTVNTSAVPSEWNDGYGLGVAI